MSMDDVAPASRAAAGGIHMLTAGIRALAAVHQWTLWKQRPALIGYCLLIETTAIVLVVIADRTAPAQSTDLIVLGVLATAGMVQAELGRHVERLRRKVTNTPHINLSSVWTFAGVLLLPPALIAALVAMLYTHLQVRSWLGLSNTRPFRTVFNASLATVTCLISYRVLTWSGVGDMHGALSLGWASASGLAFALATYFVVAAIIALPGLKPANKTMLELFGGWVDNGTELTTLMLGAVAALVLASPIPFLIGALPPLLYFAHRGLLVKQFELAATTDEKTGLFNMRGWHSIAKDALTRAQHQHEHGAVVMADLDFAKRINDDYDHLAGDDVIDAVAEAIQSCIRQDDCAARFGGDEFMILLRGVDQGTALAVAERIRTRISQLAVVVTTDSGRSTTIRGLSMSIGVAPYPEFGWDVKRLQRAADTALILAKKCGRNRVQLAAA